MTETVLRPVDRRLIFAAQVSLVVAFILMLLKFYAYSVTGSKAVLSDALESIINVMTALAATKTMKLVAEPADEEHPYGHGKIEYFSAAFEGGMIAFASIAIAAEAITALVNHATVLALSEGIGWLALAGLGNLLLGLYLQWEAKKFKSDAIHASAMHVLSDVVTTVIALIGLGLLLATGWWWIDSCLALLMAVYFAVTGVRIVRRSIGGLIDEKDPKALTELVNYMEKFRFEGLVDIHNLKLIRSGRFHHVDAHLVMPRFWSVEDAHELGEDFEQTVVKAYPYDGEIAFHVDPCEDYHCPSCNLSQCPVRARPFEKLKKFKASEVTRGPREGVG